MKKSLSLALSAAALCFLASCGNGNTTPSTDGTTTTASTTNTTADTKFSQAFGTLVGTDFGRLGITADAIVLADLTAAAQAALDGKPSMELQMANQTMQQNMEALAQAKGNPQGAAPRTPEQKTAFSQAIGTLLGDNLKQNLADSKVDVKAFSEALAAALAGTPVMTPEEAQKTYQAAAEAAMKAKQGPLEKAGKDFLATNKDKKGVTTTASGLQYEVVKEGKGAKPTIANTVKVHYHGTLIDGSVFDSSVERGEPIEFPLGNVIKGWQEGVQLMTPGSKYRFYIPHELGYGSQPAGKIPPFSTLIFDVELIAVK